MSEDPAEESKIRKLAGSRHAPGDWNFRARIVSLSWQGLRTARIAEELGCHPKTVRKHLHRFNALGIDGLGDRPGAGRKPRITEDGRSTVAMTLDTYSHYLPSMGNQAFGVMGDALG